MKFRKDVAASSESDASREEVREMAEAVSLYRSAMHHIADREAAKPFVAQPGHGRTLGLRLLLAPALAAAVAAGVLIPVFSHLHRGAVKPAPVAFNHQVATEAGHAKVDDTALMNQIDSELSEDVPDALRPLADLSYQTTTNNSVSEKKDVTQN